MQARMHNALTQTANTLAAYSYVLYLTDAADTLITIDAKASATKENIDLVLGGIESLSKGNGSSGNTVSLILDQAEAAVGDPKTTIQNIANFGIAKAQGYATGGLLQPFIGRYLATGDKSGDNYLKSVRVDGIDLSDSVIIDKNGNVKITAHYEIEYTFGALKFPFKPTLSVTQTAVTKAWLGGSGVRYLG